MIADSLTYKSHVLDVLTFAIERRISHAELGAIRHDLVLEDTANYLAVHLIAHVLGRRHDGPEIRYPMNWWDAFKARWFPAWLLRRFPARFVVVLPSMTELYPDIQAIPGQRSVVIREFGAGRIVKVNQ